MKRILVVDDEITIQGMISELLAGEDNEVFTSGTIEEAKEACSKYRFDLVITDLRLTNKNGFEGFELISHVKSLMPDTKVMLISGNGNAAVWEEAFRRGAAYCFEKPFDIFGLASKIKSCGISLPAMQQGGIVL